jgi:biotin carboxyl carrier protein
VKHFHITLQGRSFDVTVQDPHADPVSVTVDGETFEVSLESVQAASPIAGPAAPREARPAGPAAMHSAVPAAAAGRVVKAPMPGTVNRVSVKPGERVERGQELLSLEAMKMNNIIRATAPGQVAEVCVTEKQSVRHGDVLIVLED